jgi:hypothetical protein
MFDSGELSRSVAAWALTVVMLQGCGGGCPAPSVFPVPPEKVSGHAARLELPVPLSAGDGERVRRFLASCAEDGSSLCEPVLSEGQECAVRVLGTAEAFGGVEGCQGARAVRVYDARAPGVLPGFEIADWVFAHDDKGAHVIVFAGYFPQPVM